MKQFKIKHQIQDSQTSCGIACIAMVFNLSQDEIRAIADTHGIKHKDGLSELEIEYLLSILCGRHEAAYIKQTNNWLIWDRLYIISVASLNVQFRQHWIVVEMGYPENEETSMECVQVYDPQKGNKGYRYYTSFDEVNGSSVDVFEIYHFNRG